MFHVEKYRNQNIFKILKLIISHLLKVIIYRKRNSTTNKKYNNLLTHIKLNMSIKTKLKQTSQLTN